VDHFHFSQIREVLHEILKEAKMANVQIAAETAKVEALITATNTLIALANSLKATLDVLVANGSLTADDLATVQKASDEADAALASVQATVTADTPPAPAPAPAAPAKP
jgi:transcriptional regulator